MRERKKFRMGVFDRNHAASWRADRIRPKLDGGTSYVHDFLVVGGRRGFGTQS